MRNIKLLDCTLRDGGFVNDWNFGYQNIISIFNRLVKSNIDIIELGFIDDRRVFNKNKTINPSTSSFDIIFSQQDKKNSIVVGMIDYGTCSLDNISLAKDSYLDGIRVIFKKKDIEPAINFCFELKKKGYIVFVQPVSITTYSDKEMLDLIDLVNILAPNAMSLVDTYGLLHKDRLSRYFYLIDTNLKENVAIGYHSHNNFQLAYANCIELLNIRTNREIVLDSSLYGIGKSAGNCGSELLAMYLNENFNKNYDIYELLECIQNSILPIKEEHTWGYSLPYYICALNKTHPEYTKYLSNKNTLSVKSINSILEMIEEDKKLSFDKAYIEELYLKYQTKYIDDTDTYKCLEENLKGSKLLILGPGGSIVRERGVINNYIKRNNPIIISVNHLSELYNLDYVFISNSKRYENFGNKLLQRRKNTKVIITSNITPIDNGVDYILNYAKLINEKSLIPDNSMSMLLEFFIKIGIKDIAFAGFDGFSILNKDNYFEDNITLSKDKQDIKLFNEVIAKQLKTYSKYIQINFITDSEYLRKEVQNATI